MSRCFYHFTKNVAIYNPQHILHFAYHNNKAFTQLETNMKSQIKKLNEYLYTFHFNNYDYKLANKHIRELEQSNSTFTMPGCSTLRSGNYFGRNFDFFYSKLIDFVIRTDRTPDHFASIGMGCATGECTSDNIDYGIDDEVCNYIPFCVWDGINEYGVTFCTNVTPSKDLQCQTTGTNPDKPLLYSLFIGRLILDHARSAKEAIMILNNYNIVTPKISVLGSIMDLHFMIADEKDTFVVEFINNKLVYKKNQTILTNFYVSLPLQPHSCGVERYRLLESKTNQKIDSMETMSCIMESVHYSQAYNIYNKPFWYTDHFADGLLDGIDINISNYHQYQDYILNHASQISFDSREGFLVPWHTMHSSIYNIRERKFRLYVQENYFHYYTFEL